jgi:nucleotide-binding universal stress UspA family protein
MTEILVPLDGTPQSNVALPLASTLARFTDGSLTLLRVVPRSHDSHASSTVTCDLRRVAAELAGDGTLVRALVRRGDAAEQIVEHIRSQPTDMLVMRTHGRVGLGRVMLGSVTESVLTHTNVPMVLVRPGGRQVSRVSTLLVPVDGSTGSEPGIQAAVHLARTAQAEIRLLQVVVPIPIYVYGAFGPDAPLYTDSNLDEEVASNAEAYLQGTCKRLRAAGMTCTYEVRVHESAVESIARAAVDARADLIVMSTAARTGAARALLGSVTDAVVRSACCPVLIVHRKPDSAGSDLDQSLQPVLAPDPAHR